MKEVKVVIIATIVTVLILVSTAFALPAKAEADRGEFYPKLTVVVSSVRIDTGLWVVDCRDQEGNKWSFFDDEGTWEYGDIANLLMWNMGEREEDDEIIEVYWEGYTENIEMYCKIMGWK